MTGANISKDISKFRGIEIYRGETQVIIPMQERMCPSGFIFKLKSGELVVGGMMSGIDYPTDKCSMPLPPGQALEMLLWRRSYDKGKTWHAAPAWPSYGVCEFSDGEIMCLSGRWWQQLDNCPKDEYTFNLFRSLDDGYVFSKEIARVIGVPKLAIPVHHGFRTVWDCYANINHQVVKTEDGTLLAAVQGRFKNDTKERCFVIASIDRGKTWKYLSSVVFDLREEKKERWVFDEPNLLVLPDGEILCFIRTGWKLYLSRSIDNGKSWSCADPIASHSAYPTACLMKSGIIAVIYGSHAPYGEPGNWLIFSIDNGQTWISEFCLYSGSAPCDCTGYGWIEEIEPDRLLAVYSRTDPDSNKISEMVGTYLSVRRK